MQSKKALHQAVAALREQDEKNANELDALRHRLRNATIFSPRSNPTDSIPTNNRLDINQRQIKSNSVEKIRWFLKFHVALHRWANPKTHQIFYFILARFD
jgi:hypothetical protein